MITMNWSFLDWSKHKHAKLLCPDKLLYVLKSHKEIKSFNKQV